MTRVHSMVMFATVILVATGQETPMVHTPQGDIIGVAVPTQNKYVYQFRNIPYAKPPVGDLRFAKPVPKEAWTDVLDGTRFGPSCVQPNMPMYDKYVPNMNQSEDCLVLNVYVPRNLSRTANRPVMVWIHGGAFLIGQGMLYDGSSLALTGDVIVVTINYRLGIFGFLSNLQPDLPGNYGLWDQRLALVWVQRNIRSFGGDPDVVTLFGESAGGFSVSIHSILPQNKGLFHSVIAQSGVAESHFATSKNPLKFAEEAGISVGCHSSTTQPSAYLECMRRVSARNLLDVQNNFPSKMKILSLDSYLGPVVDGEFLPSSPEELVGDATSASYKFFQTLDFVSGNVNTEGSLFFGTLKELAKQMHFNYSKGIPTDVFCNNIVPEFLNAYFEMQVKSTVLTDLVCSLYGAKNKSIQGDNVLDAYSDIFFIVPALKGLRKHASSNTQTSTYQYIFKRPQLDPVLRNYPPWWLNGSSSHGSEILYVFGLEEFAAKLNITASLPEINLSRQLMKYWTNFARNGNPNANGLPTWRAFDTTNEAYIDFNTTITQGQHMYGKWMDLWLNRLPNLVHSPDPNLNIGKK